ncbi:MAG TPA: ATP-binding protein [Allosphingosinicella sp.]|jgi:two-component system sensor kinase FixL|nr:ATP-binding protein [Allosphingosinicella sp.]
MPAEVNATRELLQPISEGFVFVDGEFRVRDINETGLHMARRPRADFDGRSLWELAPQLRDSELHAMLTNALAETAPLSVEHLYTWTDGRRSCLEIRAYPAGGGLAIFYRDVTEQKQSQEALKRMQAELVEASRLSAMGTMAATLAHELAQPLTSIRAYVEAALKLLRSAPEAPAREARRPLALAVNAAERASEILKRLRGFVLKGKVEIETHDLHAIIAEAGVLMLPQAQQVNVEIDFRLDRHARWVKADAVQVQQVLVNLIRNAIEAIGEGELRHIEVATAPAPPEHIAVTVEDSGPGFDAAAEGALFTPFRSTKPSGLGIGLSLSRTIVEAHGGTIEATAARGGGAVFRFTLPRADPPA